MTALEEYLRELRTIRSSGSAVEETSYYGALANLLNEIGKTLKPKVRCVLTLKNRGAGFPDGGLFTSDQFQRAAAAEPLEGQLPARGAVELKGTGKDVWQIAKTEQVARYRKKYRLVLVSNYRDFVLIGQDEAGKAIELESYRLAESEAKFWSAAAHPRKVAAEHSLRFAEFLKRVVLHAAPLASPQDLAWFLASYARDAKARVEDAELPALASVREALEEALGLRFEGEKGEHFFRSSLVQTLFYGMFSAWVLWSREHPPTCKARFNWHEAAWSLRVPMIRALFEQVATPSKLGPLNLVEVLDRAEVALNRVDRAGFFERFDEGHAVQYFYEPFLEAFDPQLRKQLGVWYTPPEIVEYMVGRVDTVLREELDIPDGFADPRVYVLDPCCGTGAYLVEVLKRIEATLKQKGADALGSHDVKRAAMERVCGFELLPAPFVVAHLQLGLLLQNQGVPLSDKNNERVGVYLTNALTGWEPPKGPKQHLMFPELEEERDAAERVKRDAPILVVLGNPPYNAFAGVSPAEEQGLVEPYKEGLVSEWGIKKFNLDDLYVRFFRLAERRIAEMTNRGVVCYISNHSYLSDPSFVVMRRRFLSQFDALWFDELNGDSRETGKLTPDGKPDPSVFSTELNREGIRVGTAIGLMVRRSQRAKKARVRYREFWGVGKRAGLVGSLERKRFDSQYRLAKPDQANRYSFRRLKVLPSYRQWPSVSELAAIAPSNGLMEKRGGALIDLSRKELEKRMSAYYDSKYDWEEYAKLGYGLTRPQARFDPRLARRKAQESETFSRERIVRYVVRPFETRWAYYTAVRPVWNEPRPSLWAQCWKGNGFLMTRPAGVATPEGMPFYFTRLLGDNDFLRGHAYYFPVQLKNGKRLDRKGQRSLFEMLGEETEEDSPIANLSKAARDYLAELGIKNPDANSKTAEWIWMHVLAVGCSPDYLEENADGVRQDWPRVPMAGSKNILLASAALGRQVAALLDCDTPLENITRGRIRDELEPIGVISRAGGGHLNPDKGDLDVTAGWGHSGKGGATMPGKGRLIEREYTRDERAAITEGAKVLGIPAQRAFECLGKTTCDVYLNDVAYWRNVPAKVWGCVIGGYQVVKKWLSYREADLLGRALTNGEARDVTSMARRLAAFLLLQPALNANYQVVSKSAFPWGD
ncbi:MAG: N-6 DNA methylase [Candidatus Nealsonbacteria bacterium]|nr:N-6 DNA methylase [Candidatus Nealsonbacteria bacterium]